MVPANFSFDFQGHCQRSKVKGHGSRTYGTDDYVMIVVVIL